MERSSSARRVRDYGIVHEVGKRMQQREVPQTVMGIIDADKAGQNTVQMQRHGKSRWMF